MRLRQASRPIDGLDLRERVGSYLRRRLEIAFTDTYRDRRITKFPEDLHAYERFMWEMRADAVIEFGVQYGGSTMWFRDRLNALGHKTVIAVDMGPNPDLPDDIVFLQADVLDPELPEKIRVLLPPDARPFIIEDTAHTFETTSAVLNGFHSFVPEGGYLIIEDGVVDVDELRIDPAWPRGVRPAIDAFLREHAEFEAVPSPYGVTCHPGGFLRRSASS